MASSSSSGALLARRYSAGQVLRYRMKGSNDGWEYTLVATDTVRRDPSGHFFEEIGWSGLQSNAPMVLTPASMALRQTVSLDDPGDYMRIPDLTHVQPALIGPITDLLTFYSDRMLVLQQLTRELRSAYVVHAAPNTWADGQHFVVAQDAVDFDLSLEGVDEAAHTARVVVRHVPPKQIRVQIVAPWMAEPVAGAPNNWVQVSHTPTGYLAEIGSETFVAQMLIDTSDGKILSVQMDNPITAVRRECEDAKLTQCEPATRETLRREVSLTLLP